MTACKHRHGKSHPVAANGTDRAAVNVPSANVWTVVVAVSCGMTWLTAVIATGTLCHSADPIRDAHMHMSASVRYAGDLHHHRGNSGCCTG